MKKSITVAATITGLVLAVGTTSVVLADSSNASVASNSRLARNAKLPGDVVVAWNQELLRIVQTPGLQPATIHPTRSYAMLHAAIYDAVVAITRDASPLLVSVKAPRDARPDAAAAAAGAATLKALYPTLKGRSISSSPVSWRSSRTEPPSSRGSRSVTRSPPVFWRFEPTTDPPPHRRPSLPAPSRATTGRPHQTFPRPSSPTGARSPHLS